MKYIELFENFDPKWVDIIKNDCSIYLENNPSKVSLFRGIDGPLIDFKKIDYTTRDYSRIKYDQPYKEATIELNGLMKQAGFIATRENVFLSISENHVFKFGRPYVVFPIGDYSLTWIDRAGLVAHLNKKNRPLMHNNPDMLDLGGSNWYLSTIYQIKDHPNDPEMKGSVAEVFWNLSKNYFMQGKDPYDPRIHRSEVYMKSEGGYYIMSTSYFMDLKKALR